MRRGRGVVSECVSTWVTTAAFTCAIKTTYPTDSGEYWCEAGEETSNAVNITVTGDRRVDGKYAKVHLSEVLSESL